MRCPNSKHGARPVFGRAAQSESGAEWSVRPLIPSSQVDVQSEFCSGLFGNIFCARQMDYFVYGQGSMWVLRRNCWSVFGGCQQA